MSKSSAASAAKDPLADFGLDFNWAENLDLNPRVINVEGEEYSGKSYLALTCPDPIAYMSFDYGESRVLPHFVGKKRIGVKRYHFDFDAGLKQRDETEAQAKHIRQSTWNPWEADYRKFASSGKFKTIVWDKAGDVNQLLRLANFGKITQIPQEFYGIVNAEFKELVQFAKKCGVNLVMVHDLKEEYDEKIVDSPSGPKKQRFKTGKLLRQGNNAIGYLVDISVRMKLVSAKDEPVKFQGQILKAGARKDSVGMILDNPDYDTIMAFTTATPEGASDGAALNLEI